MVKTTGSIDQIINQIGLTPYRLITVSKNIGEAIKVNACDEIIMGVQLAGLILKPHKSEQRPNNQQTQEKRQRQFRKQTTLDQKEHATDALDQFKMQFDTYPDMEDFPILKESKVEAQPIIQETIHQTNHENRNDDMFWFAFDSFQNNNSSP